VLRLTLTALLVCGTTLAWAEEPAKPEQNRPARADAQTRGVLALLPGDATTEHAISINGQRLEYAARTGTFGLFDQDGERSAAIFYTAYTRKNADRTTRPLTFVFNGGPGAASVYLHLGVAGPKVVDAPDLQSGAPQLRENPATWLRFTDLVFIDPVGTGWSRASKPDGNGKFWGVRQDASAVAKVIALYVAQNSRNVSPKYILGESYGGFRAFKVARALLEEQGISIEGVVAVSPLLDGGLLFGASRYPFGAALQLPSLAAAELDRTGRFTPEALAAAERFALTDYLPTLAGAPPQGDVAQQFYARVAQLTGLPLDVVTRSQGFIRDTYVKNAMRSRGEVVSHYDAAFAAPDPFPESASAEGGDPVLDGYTQALGAAFVAYARDELRFHTDMTFMLLNREVSGKWEWNSGHGGRTQASVTGDLRELMSLVAGFRVLVVHGRADIVTPYAASRYVLDHLPPGLRERAALKTYAGGHMFYLQPNIRAEFSAEAERFYRGGTGEGAPSVSRPR
jgi:carboxypeptidase C (cathepsin A)